MSSVSPTTTKKKCYYAIASCDALKGGSIFVDWRDCEILLSPEHNDELPDYKVCNSLLDAVMYIEPFDVVEFNRMSMSLVGKPQSTSRRTRLRRSLKASSTPSEDAAAAASTPASVETRKRTLEKAFPALATRSTSKQSNKKAKKQQQRMTRSMTMTNEARKLDDDLDDALDNDNDDDDDDNPSSAETEKEWEEKFELLRQFYNKNGTCKVKQTRKHKADYPGLFEWVKYNEGQIRKHQSEEAEKGKEQADAVFGKHGPLNPVRIQRLKALLGMEAEHDEGHEEEPKAEHPDFRSTPKKDEQWESRFEMLTKYKKEYGQCNTVKSKAYGEYRGLVDWVKREKAKVRAYQADPTKASYKIPDRIRRLSELGFTAATKALEAVIQNQKKTDKVKQEKESSDSDYDSDSDSDSDTDSDTDSDSDSDSVTVDEEDADDNSTVTKNRKSSKKKKKSNDSEGEDDDPDVVGSPTKYDELWERKFEMLQKYTEEYGIGLKFTKEAESEYPGLRFWLGRQKQKLRQFEADPTSVSRKDSDRIRRLKEIAFTPDKNAKSTDKEDPESEAVNDKPDVLGSCNKQDEKWERMFEMLKKFAVEYGTFSLIKEADREYPGLRRWVGRQKQKIRQSERDPTSVSSKDAERISRLKELERSISPAAIIDDKYIAARLSNNADLNENNESDPVSVDEQQEWESKFELLRRFFYEHRTCQVEPSIENEEDYPGLSEWVRHNREQIGLNDSEQADESGKEQQSSGADGVAEKPGVLTPERISRLKAYFTAEKNQKPEFFILKTAEQMEAERWERKFQMLQEYKEEYGQCCVIISKALQDYPGLRDWVKRQKQKLEQFEKDPTNVTCMDPDRVRRLTDLGFTADAAVAAAVVKDLKKKIKKCDDDENEDKEEKEKRKSQVLTEKWEKSFEMLQKFKEEFGHVSVPRFSKEVGDSYRSLNMWLYNQRKAMQLYNEDPTPTKKMNEDRMKRLTDLGVTPLESYGDCWEQKFEMLQQFKEKYGHVHVKKNGKQYGETYSTLNDWLHKQRKAMQAYNENPTASRTNPDRVRRLTELGVSPFQKKKEKEEEWEQNYQMLRKFREEYGHASVTIKKPEYEAKYPKLGQWVTQQKIALNIYAEDPARRPWLNEDRVKRLKDLGVDETKDQRWERNFEMLQNYKEEYGSLNVPDKHRDETGEITKKYPGLATWLNRQRFQLRDYLEDPTDPNVARLNPDRVRRLQELGVEQAARRVEEGWDEMFAELEEFKEINGHTNVPQKPRTPLRNWVDRMREYYRRLQQGQSSRLNATQVAKLVALGFQFVPPKRSTFNESAVKWLEYKTRTGKVDVAEDGTLKSWVQTTRREYYLYQQGEKSRLTEEQIDRLNEWGFKWSCNIKRPERIAKPRPWEERFQQLLEFKAKHGHTKVPQKYPELGSWVHKQRQNYRKYKEGRKTMITKEQIDKLKKADFVFLTRKRPRRSSADDKEADANKQEDSDDSDDSDESEEYYSDYYQQQPPQEQPPQQHPPQQHHNYHGNYY